MMNRTAGVVLITAVFFFGLLICILVPLVVLSSNDTKSDAHRRAREASAADTCTNDASSALIDGIGTARAEAGFVAASMNSTPDMRGTAEERTKGQYFSTFNSYAIHLSSTAQGLVLLGLAPGGVINQVYPAGSGWEGADIMNQTFNDLYSPTPAESVRNGRMSIIGPVEHPLLKIDKWIVFVRRPVYNYTVTNKPSFETFWGFTYACIGVIRLLNQLSVADEMNALGMDYITYTHLTSQNNTLAIIESSFEYDRSLTDEQVVKKFLVKGVTRSVLTNYVNWSFAVRSREFEGKLTRNLITVIVVSSLFGFLALYAITLSTYLYLTREYDGQQFAPKAPPFAAVIIGLYRGEDLLELAPDQMPNVTEDVQRRVHRHIARHKLYENQQLRPYTFTLLTRNTENAVQFCFDVIEDVLESKSYVMLRTLLGDQSRPCISAVVHWCNNAAVMVDPHSNELRYNGPDLMQASMMWAYSDPNEVIVSSTAHEKLRNMPSVVMTPAGSLYVNGVSEKQEYFHVTDPARKKLAVAKDVAKQVMAAASEQAKGMFNGVDVMGPFIADDDDEFANMDLYNDNMDDNDDSSGHHFMNYGRQWYTAPAQSQRGPHSFAGSSGMIDALACSDSLSVDPNSRRRHNPDSDEGNTSGKESQSFLIKADKPLYPSAKRGNVDSDLGSVTGSLVLEKGRYCPNITNIVTPKNGEMSGYDESSSNGQNLSGTPLRSGIIAPYVPFSVSSLQSPTSATAASGMQHGTFPTTATSTAGGAPNTPSSTLHTVAPPASWSTRKKENVGNVSSQYDNPLSTTTNGSPQAGSRISTPVSSNSSPSTASPLANSPPHNEASLQANRQLTAEPAGSKEYSNVTQKISVPSSPTTGSMHTSGQFTRHTPLLASSMQSPRMVSPSQSSPRAASAFQHKIPSNAGSPALVPLQVAPDGTAAPQTDTDAASAAAAPPPQKLGESSTSAETQPPCAPLLTSALGDAHSLSSTGSSGADADRPNGGVAHSSPNPPGAAAATPMQSTGWHNALLHLVPASDQLRSGTGNMVSTSTTSMSTYKQQQRTSQPVLVVKPPSPMTPMTKNNDKPVPPRSPSNSNSSALHASGNNTSSTGGTHSFDHPFSLEINPQNRRESIGQSAAHDFRVQQSQAALRRSVGRSTPYAMMFLNPCMPVWVDASLRAAFDQEAIAYSISYDALRALIYHFFCAYRSMLKPFAAPERTNIYRRLVMAFGIPQQNIVEHLAVRCALQYMYRQQDQRATLIKLAKNTTRATGKQGQGESNAATHTTSKVPPLPGWGSMPASGTGSAHRGHQSEEELAPVSNKRKKQERRRAAEKRHAGNEREALFRVYSSNSSASSSSWHSNSPGNAIGTTVNPRYVRSRSQSSGPSSVPGQQGALSIKQARVVMANEPGNGTPANRSKMTVRTASASVLVRSVEATPVSLSSDAPAFPAHNSGREAIGIAVDNRGARKRSSGAEYASDANDDEIDKERKQMLDRMRNKAPSMMS